MMFVDGLGHFGVTISANIMVIEFGNNQTIQYQKYQTIQRQITLFCLLQNIAIKPVNMHETSDKIYSPFNRLPFLQSPGISDLVKTS